MNHIDELTAAVERMKTVDRWTVFPGEAKYIVEADFDAVLTELARIRDAMREQDGSELARLRQENEALREQVRDFDEDNRRLAHSLRTAEAKIGELGGALIANDPEALHQYNVNNKLRTENGELLREVERLKTELEETRTCPICTALRAKDAALAATDGKGRTL